MVEFGFIYISLGLDPDKQRAIIPSEQLNMTVIGCSSYEEAEKAAIELVTKGCQVIELCVGFGHEGVARIKKAVGEMIPVGVVRFDSDPSLGFKSGDSLFQ